MSRILPAFLCLTFLAIGCVTIAAPELWEYYGILLTTDRAKNQFVSVVGGGEIAVGLLCGIVAFNDRPFIKLLFVVAVILGTISIVRAFAFLYYGGLGMKLGVEWALELLGAVLCLIVANRSEKQNG